MQQLIEKTHLFQAERKGMSEHNTIEVSLSRALQEFQEVREALEHESLENVKLELLDVALFIASALVYMGVSMAEAQELLDTKHRANERRYDPVHFDLVGQTVGGTIFTTQDAIDRSRHFAKVEPWEGSDVY